MIRSITLLLSLLAIALTNSSGAAELAGVKIDDKVKLSASGPDLVLNGAGLRTRYQFKVYVAALYLPEKKPDAARSYRAEGPQASAALAHARRRGGPDVHRVDSMDSTRTCLPPIWRSPRPQIQQLNATLVALRELKEGDIMTFDLLPGAGTRISVNGQLRRHAHRRRRLPCCTAQDLVGRQPRTGGTEEGAAGTELGCEFSRGIAVIVTRAASRGIAILGSWVCAHDHSLERS